MKFILAVAFLAVALAAPQGNAGFGFSYFDSVINSGGSYSYGFESADGTRVSQSGSQKQIGPNPWDSGSVKWGSISYITPDGNTVMFNYEADENGYRIIQ